MKIQCMSIDMQCIFTNKINFYKKTFHFHFYYIEKKYVFIFLTFPYYNKIIILHTSATLCQDG